MQPTAKITAVGVAAAFTTIIVWLVSVALSVDVPATVAAAITGVVAFVLGYLVPDKQA